ncbi:hydroxyproline O-arabinosyltransferase 3-like [Ipomoea triloba]|uniref:hydroxyproline O-arabinosyltransferase 3-like n=1 Tax=Ipomoea triloba TaxID=35885 RepID=UPI00125E2073|nr:hydroxyproline O-arabinosyltransferase 3-like [Ipomoea triloba]
MGRATMLFLVLLSFGFFLATYNVMMTIIHYKIYGYGEWIISGLGSQSRGDPVLQMPEKTRGPGMGKPRFHIAVTAESSLYSKWQSRIMYYWYKKQKDLPGSEMGKFTRILHTGAPDNLMDEIPTVVVDPLPNGLDMNYVVLNRPWAFVQWLEIATIEEEYILMAEPDHIFVRPLPNLVFGDYPVGFSFFYIEPSKHERIIRKFFPEENGPITKIDPIGNSPVIIKKDLLEEIAPTWLNLSVRIKYDPEADETFGWVQEMYAYAVASALHGVQHLLREDFMIQPPWDLETRKKYILHFTYDLDYNAKGEMMPYGVTGDWEFKKRSYFFAPPPRNFSLPPPGAPESVVTLIEMINEATANLPDWDSLR